MCCVTTLSVCAADLCTMERETGTGLVTDWISEDKLFWKAFITASYGCN